MLAPGGLGSPETATRVFGLDEIGPRQGEHFLNGPQGMFKKEKRVLLYRRYSKKHFGFS
jgi:hypothetical protein